MAGTAVSMHHPPTTEQRSDLRADLIIVEERVQNIAILMHACYGDENQAAIRADEVDGAVQRLKWALDRMKEQAQAAG